MKLIYKINLAAIGLLAVSALLAGPFRSFAVEIRDATKLIASVKKESTQAVEAMEDGRLKVEEGVRTVEELGETIRRAAENSEKASGASRGIAQATTEQYKGIRRIAASSQTINEMSQEIARATRE